MSIVVGQDTAKARKTLTVNGETLAYYSIPAAQASGLGDFSNIPASLRVVLENMLRLIHNLHFAILNSTAPKLSAPSQRIFVLQKTDI